MHDRKVDYLDRHRLTSRVILPQPLTHPLGKNTYSSELLYTQMVLSYGESNFKAMSLPFIAGKYQK